MYDNEIAIADIYVCDNSCCCGQGSGSHSYALMFLFQFLCSYILFPFALVMGVEVNDCRKVAKLIGKYAITYYLL